MIADTLQSAADQTIAAEAAAESGKTEAAKPAAVAETKSADKDQKPATVTAAATEAAPAQDGSIQVAALAPQTKSTSLFGMFGKSRADLLRL